jgi:shikimate kinase
MTRIFLIGYMGAGKTTVGKELARCMNLSFLDLDAHIEARYHKTIGRLFDELGEPAFRRIEQRMLHEVSMFEDVLISTGGGAPCFFDNMAFMKTAGRTLYLDVSPRELARRLSNGRHTRPVLGGREGEELLAFITETLTNRSPFYQQADFVYTSDRLPVDAELQALAQQLI